jgi:hypothetical protein
LREECRLRVFENGVLRKPQNEEFNELYCSSNSLSDKIENKMGGHVARMGEKNVYTGFWWGNLRERNHLGNTGVDGRNILRWIFRKSDVGEWTGLRWIRIGTGGRHL